MKLTIILLFVAFASLGQVKPANDTIKMQLNHVRQAKLSLAWQTFLKEKEALQVQQINDQYDEKDILFFKETDFVNFKIVLKKK